MNSGSTPLQKVSEATLTKQLERLTTELQALQQELFESERYIAWLTRSAGSTQNISPISHDTTPGNGTDYIRSLEKALTAKEDARYALEQRLTALEDKNIILRMIGWNWLKRILERRRIKRAHK